MSGDQQEPEPTEDVDGSVEAESPMVDEAPRVVVAQPEDYLSDEERALLEQVEGALQTGRAQAAKRDSETPELGSVWADETAPIPNPVPENEPPEAEADAEAERETAEYGVSGSQVDDEFEGRETIELFREPEPMSGLTDLGPASSDIAAIAVAKEPSERSPSAAGDRSSRGPSERNQALDMAHFDHPLEAKEDSGAAAAAKREPLSAIEDDPIERTVVTRVAPLPTRKPEPLPESTEGMPELELFRDPRVEREEDRESLEADIAQDETQEPEKVQPKPRQEKRLIVISGAKGGVGKTMVATNLALYLATIGRKVILVDADQDGANAHTFLGCPPPHPVEPYDPPPVFFRETPPDGDKMEKIVSDAIQPPSPDEMGGDDKRFSRSFRGASERRLSETPVPNLRLLYAGLDGPAKSRKRKKPRRALLLDELKAIEADYYVVDLGSGTHPNIIDLYLAADVTLFVATPEPTAMEGTARFIRAAFARYLRRFAPNRKRREALVEYLLKYERAPIPSEFARMLDDDDAPVLAAIVRDAMATFTVPLLINQARMRDDLDLGDQCRTVIRRRLGVLVDYLGYIDFDDTVLSCVRAQRPLLIESPGSKAAKSIERTARRIMAIDGGTRKVKPPRVPKESHHDVLEIDRGDGDEEIRRAYKRLMRVYATGSLASYGFFDARGLATARARVQEAYDVLMDRAQRRPYELSVFPSGELEDAEAEAQDNERPVATPPAPIITPDTEFTGSLIRAVRLARGVSVEEISQRTKIGREYLEAIEGENFRELPAPVYVRGFVSQMARLLRLDGEHVSRTYVRRYRAFLESAAAR